MRFNINLIYDKNSSDKNYTGLQVEDTVEVFLNSLQDDNGYGDKNPGIGWIDLDYFLEINDKKFMITVNFFSFFPQIFFSIKEKSYDLLDFSNSGRGNYYFEFLDNNKIKLKFLYNDGSLNSKDWDLVKKELKEDKNFESIILTKEEFLTPIYKEIYKFIEYFEKNANRELLPRSFYYLKKLKDFLDKNSIEVYNDDSKELIDTFKE